MLVALFERKLRFVETIDHNKVSNSLVHRVGTNKLLSVPNL